MANATARAISDIIDRAPRQHLNGLLMVVEDLIEARSVHLEDEEYRTRLTVPLREVVQIAADDEDLVGLRITEVLADCLRTWQSQKRTVLAPMSWSLIDSRYSVFKGPMIKTPHALLTVAFVPWASDATNLAAALAGPFPVTAASKFYKYRSTDDGLTSEDRGYDLFVISVLIAIEEHGKHPELDLKHKLVEGAGGSGDAAKRVKAE